MVAIEEIRALLIPIKEVDFKIFSLERSKSIFKGEKFYLKKLEEDSSFEKLNDIYWQVNNETFGEYCRNIITQFDELEINIECIIPYRLKQEVSNSIIGELNDIIQNDSQIKYSISLDSETLFEKIQNSSFKTFREISIDRIFNFRKQHLETFIKKIQISLVHEKQVYELTYDSRQELPVKKTARKITKNDGNKILGTHGFSWNKKRDLTRDTVILHSYLRDHMFIHKDTPINSLKDAFSGGFLLEPLAIKWTKKVKGKDSKGLLFHFIEQLEHLNFINIVYQNNELFNKLETIFCDSKGDALGNLAVSKSQWLNQRRSEKTPQELELDSILYTLLYSDSNKSLN